MIVTVRARGRIGGVRHHGLVRAAHADLGVEGGGQKEEAGGAASLGRLPALKSHRGCSRRRLCAQNRKEPISRQGADLAYVFLEKKDAALPK